MGWFIFVIIVAAVIIWILKDIKETRINNERQQEENNRIENIYYNSNNYFQEGYKQRQPVTGDYFLSSNFSSYNIEDSYEDTKFLFCRYANTANCVNCSRRKEHCINNLYYYGVSYNCKETTTYYKDHD